MPYYVKFITRQINDTESISYIQRIENAFINIQK